MSKKRMNLIAAGMAFTIFTLTLIIGSLWLRFSLPQTAATMAETEDGRAEKQAGEAATGAADLQREGQTKADLPEKSAGEGSLLVLLEESPVKLNAVRLKAAVHEWYAAPNGPIALDHYATIAHKELTRPDSVASLLAELVKMYEGEAPFTKLRVVSLEYYAAQEPLASMLKTIGKSLPLPSLYPDDDPETSKVAVQQSYTALRAYIETALKVLS